MAGRSARIFNHALAAASIAALDELGLLDQVRAAGPVRVAEFCRARGLHPPTVVALARALVGAGVLAGEPASGAVEPGPAFEEVFRDKGYFLWLVRGYGRMLETLADIAREESRRGDFAGRDPRYIAIAGRDYGARFVEGEFRRTLAAFPFHTVCDLGCGSADRLIRLLRDHPEARGIGVELHPGTVALAREAVERSGLAARLRIVEADIARVEPDPGFAQVDLLLAFFNGHDLWPRERCRAALDRIHAAFPAARRFLLCDTWRSDLEAAAEPPTFTLGFELTHAAMGQYVPSAPEWRELFAETSWRLAGEHPIGIPFSTIFDLRSRAGDGRESPGNGG